MDGAFPVFNTVWMLDHRAPAATCAYCVLALDSQQLREAPKEEADRAFGALRKLADENPNDVMIRWMLAVQCRSWERNEEGVEAYKQILEQWHPGPALVHQTYGNLLDNLNRYDEALVERYLVVKMEPASWSYDGLANTLQGLSRFDEACQAHAIATRMDPRSSIYWSNWDVVLNGQDKHDEAIEKCYAALRLHARNWWRIGCGAKPSMGKENRKRPWKSARSPRRFLPTVRRSTSTSRIWKHG